MTKAFSYPGETDWRAQSDMSTLVTAEQIRSDPKRLKAALGEAKKQAAGLAAVTADGTAKKPPPKK